MTESELEQAYQEYQRLKDDDNRKKRIVEDLSGPLGETREAEGIELYYRRIEGVDRGRRVWVRWPDHKEDNVIVTGMSDIDMVLAVTQYIKGKTEKG